MIEEMLTKSRNIARAMGLSNVEFREGILEKLPVEDAWADVQISNGVINLCADKQHAFSEVRRVLKSGGHPAICRYRQWKAGALRLQLLTLIFGRPELPVVCRVQPGKK